MDILEMNSFICGDCMEYLPQFPDKYFDIAVVDPEYGRKEHGGRNRSGYVKQKNGSMIYVSDGQYQNRNWDNEPPDRRYFDELIRVSKHRLLEGVSFGINATTVPTSPVLKSHTAV